MDFKFTDEEKKLLHDVAIYAIRSRCLEKPFPNLGAIPTKLQDKYGAFVTIKKNGNLRGCIGTVISQINILDTIKTMAIRAAFSDPRFTPVIGPELDHLEVEISVLSPLKKIKDISEIEVGKHGILIQNQQYSGLLLPQVAIEQNWNLNQFVESVCKKAGLKSTAYSHPSTILYTFEADVF